MAESVELPSRLAILPFRNKLLLPGAIIRIRCTSPSSVKLVEQELWQSEEKGLIGVLPVRDSEAAAVDSILSPGGGSDSGERSLKPADDALRDSQKQEGKNQQELIHWHNRGVAARAIYLSRGVEKPSGRVTYIVVLEGLCRFSVQELSARGIYCVARISSLDMTKADEAMLEKVLGPPRFDDREAAERVATAGISVGLVWTSFGGEVQFVEATAMAGKGDLHLTGQLGDVIKESAQIALTWVRARAAEFKLSAGGEVNLLENRDVHIHFPAGAVPKDGPSAGVTLVTSLVSLFSQRKVRADTAMTGEMTLRGLVLPVGGIKDKVLAAHRYGIKRVILPERNLKDLVEVPSAILGGMEILFAKQMEDVLEHAFEGGCPWRQHSKL